MGILNRIQGIVNKKDPNKGKTAEEVTETPDGWSKMANEADSYTTHMEKMEKAKTPHAETIKERISEQAINRNESCAAFGVLKELGISSESIKKHMPEEGGLMDRFYEGSVAFFSSSKRSEKDIETIQKFFSSANKSIDLLSHNYTITFENGESYSFDKHLGYVVPTKGNALQASDSLRDGDDKKKPFGEECAIKKLADYYAGEYNDAKDDGSRKQYKDTISILHRLYNGETAEGIIGALQFELSKSQAFQPQKSPYDLSFFGDDPEAKSIRKASSIFDNALQESIGKNPEKIKYMMALTNMIGEQVKKHSHEHAFYDECVSKGISSYAAGEKL